MDDRLPVAMMAAFLLGWSIWGFHATRPEWVALAIALSFVAGHMIRILWR